MTPVTTLTAATDEVEIVHRREDPLLYRVSVRNQDVAGFFSFSDARRWANVVINHDPEDGRWVDFGVPDTSGNYFWVWEEA